MSPAVVGGGKSSNEKSGKLCPGRNRKEQSNVPSGIDVDKAPRHSGHEKIFLELPAVANGRAMAVA